MSVVRPPEFDPKWRRKRRWSARWRAMRPWLVVAAIVALAALFTGMPSSTADSDMVDRRFTLCGEQGSAACVIDGDTIAIGKRRVRLSGFDAPELDGACEAERAKALDARTALQQWLNRGPFMVDGGEQPPRDQYGRELRQARRVSADGSEEWLGDWMIEQGVAGGSGWGATAVDWCG